MFNTLTDKSKLTDTLPLNGDEKKQPITEPSVIRVDLHDYGFKQAGATGAEPAALKNYLDDIHNGFVVDVNENEDEQRKEREKREVEIDKLHDEKLTRKQSYAK